MKLHNSWWPIQQPLLDESGGGGAGEELDLTNATGDKAGEEDDLDDEISQLAVVDGKGNKMVPLSALVGSKKQVKALNKRVKELEPIAERTSAVEANLAKVQPIIDAVVSNPKLRADAIKLAGGTRASAPTTDQPTDDEDPDAAAIAEEFGFYLSDGQTPDLARGRRVLSKLDARNGRAIDTRVAPLAGAVVGSRAERNIGAAMEMTDDSGVPLATRESIEETVRLMGGPSAALLADPRVVELVVNNAIGLDRRKGRTPKAPDEPLYLERHTGSGGRRSEAIDSETRGMMTRVGLNDKDMNSALTNLSKTPTGRGVRLE